MPDYKNFIKQDLGVSKKHIIFNNFFDTVNKFINKTIPFFRKILAALKLKSTSKFNSKFMKSQNKKNFDDMGIYPLKPQTLVDNTLKYIDALIEHENNINVIGNSKLSDSKSQPIIEKNNLNYENTIKSFGFTNADGECDYDKFFKQITKNLEFLDLKTPIKNNAEDAKKLNIDYYEKVKSELNEIVKNNYRTTWKEEIQNKKQNDNQFYNGL
jgi:hypothetical protein